jgi:hypothetical protein
VELGAIAEVQVLGDGVTLPAAAIFDGLSSPDAAMCSMVK